MKKRTVVIIVCVVCALLAAGGGLGWYFLSGNGKGEDGNVVYVNTVAKLLNLGAGNGLENRYAGVVEAGNTWSVEKNAEKSVKEIYVEIGQEVQVGTPLFTYDTDQFTIDLEQAKLDLERMNNEMTAMNDNIAQLEKDRKNAPKDQQASLTLEIQQAELELRRKEYEAKSKSTEIDRIQEDIVSATVVSELAGMVKSINDGEDQQASTYGEQDNSFITVVATGEFKIKGKINELNLQGGSFYEGMPVVVHSRADGEQTWTGTVGKVDTENGQAGSQNMYYGNSDDMTQSTFYPFYVDLNSTQGLMLGQHVYVEADNGQTEEEPGLWLPEYFISDVDTHPYVWADNGKERLEKRSVTLGGYHEDQMEYEIVSGLSEEDAITFPEDGLEEGMPTVLSTDGMMGQSNPAGEELPEDGMEMMPEDGLEGIPEDGGGMDGVEGMPEDGMEMMPEDGLEGMPEDGGEMDGLEGTPEDGENTDGADVVPEDGGSMGGADIVPEDGAEPGDGSVGALPGNDEAAEMTEVKDL